VGFHPVASRMTVPTPNDRYWEERAQSLEREALSSVRKAAENWRTGILGLTTFVGIAGSIIGLVVVPRGQPTSAGLTSAAAAIVGCFISFVIASWLAMNASYGHPKQIYTAGSALREWAISEANSAAKQLKCSRIWAGLGLLLLAIGASVLILQPTESGVPMKVTDTQGRDFCGAVTANSNGELVLTARDGTVRTVVPRTLQKASFPASC